MAEHALILNAGSSSLKFCVYNSAGNSDWTLQTRGQIDGIGTAPQLTAKDARGQLLALSRLENNVRDGQAALNNLASWLRFKYGDIRVSVVGHRVVHGGARYTQATRITRDVLVDLYQIIPLAPLHQPHNLAAIERSMEGMPDACQVACFDTSFHQTHPSVAKLVPLPIELRKNGLQRYGFHGLSYEYISSVLPSVAPEIAQGRVIVAHLGSGASLCALKAGVSVDCTLSFTALDGLCMGTRPGVLDPGVVLYLFQNLGLSPKEVETILYKKSGLLGISGISSDMRELVANSDPDAQLAIEYFVYRAVKEIGSMAAVLGGVDGLVFTAGIGENSPEVRRRICDGCAWLGLQIDAEANSQNSSRISTRDSKVSAWVIPTDEELMIVRHAGELLGLVQAAA